MKERLSGKEVNGMFQLLANMDFRHDDEELERRISDYQKARAALQSYLSQEGLDLTVHGPSEQRSEAVSGN